MNDLKNGNVKKRLKITLCAGATISGTLITLNIL